jgi:hypothetical protein
MKAEYIGLIIWFAIGTIVWLIGYWKIRKEKIGLLEGIHMYLHVAPFWIVWVIIIPIWDYKDKKRLDKIKKGEWKDLF